jgi:hypothetical protein
MMTKLLNLAAFVALLSAAAVTAQDAHAHGHKCACEAKEMGFTIDCKAPAALTAAEAFLAANSSVCSVKGNTLAGCQKNYLLLQAHHDFCPHDDIAATVKQVIHVYEDVYTDCEIPRQFVSTLSACPAVTCTTMKTAGATSAKALYDNCTSSCASATCKAAFQTVLMAHDVCEEDQLPTTLEKALHDYEEKCEAHLCNSRTTLYDPAAEACPAEAAFSGSAGRVAGVAALVAATAASFLFA